MKIKNVEIQSYSLILNNKVYQKDFKPDVVKQNTFQAH